MRWLFTVASALVLLIAAVQALSTAGTRLLVVLDEGTEKGSYSKFWEDLEGERLQQSNLETEVDLIHLQLEDSNSPSNLSRMRSSHYSSMAREPTTTSSSSQHDLKVRTLFRSYQRLYL